MSERQRNSGRFDDTGQPPSITALAADDDLLDLLGRGDVPSEGDDVATMLAGWRHDLDDAEPDREHEWLRSVLPPTAPDPAGSRLHRAGHRLRRIAVVGVAATVAALLSLLVVARTAGPDSPLWGLSRVVYSDRAEVILAEQALTRARTAITQGRWEDAVRYADEADAAIRRVRDRSEATRLQTALDEIRRMLAARLAGSTQPGGPGPGGPAGSTAPGNPGGQPGVAPGPSGGSGAPQPSGAPGLPLPSLPLPTLPLPCVSVPQLPPVLPLPTLPPTVLPCPSS